MLRASRLRTTLSVLAFLLVAAPLTAQEKRPLTLDDYGNWSRIQQTVLSSDGKWMAWVQRPNEGDATLFVKELDGNSVHTGVNGTGAAFSDDGRWVSFLTSPPEEEAEQLRKQKKPVPRTLHLIDLRSGESQEETSVRAFSFSEGGRFLAIHRDRSDADAEHTGSDLEPQLLGFGSHDHREIGASIEGERELGSLNRQRHAASLAQRQSTGGANLRLLGRHVGQYLE